MKNNKKTNKVEKVVVVEVEKETVVDSKPQPKKVNKPKKTVKPDTKVVENIVKIEDMISEDLREASLIIVKLPIYVKWFQRLRNLFKRK